jgi:hypothetical protein
MSGVGEGGRDVSQRRDQRDPATRKKLRQQKDANVDGRNRAVVADSDDRQKLHFKRERTQRQEEGPQETISCVYCE